MYVPTDSKVPVLPNSSTTTHWNCFKPFPGLVLFCAARRLPLWFDVLIYLRSIPTRHQDPSRFRGSKTKLARWLRVQWIKSTHNIHCKSKQVGGRRVRPDRLHPALPAALRTNYLDTVMTVSVRAAKKKRTQQDEKAPAGKTTGPR